MRSQLPSTTGNVKLGQLLETYLDEVARDSSISLGKFVSLADLFTEFPRDSDDGVYRAIDTFLKVLLLLLLTFQQNNAPASQCCVILDEFFTMFQQEVRSRASFEKSQKQNQIRLKAILG